MGREIPQCAVDLVKHFEGFSPRVYICPAGYPTIGYGHVCAKDHPEIDATAGEAYLRADMVKAATAVAKNCPRALVDMTDEQYGALVSFVFNVGTGAFAASTLRRKVNAGEWGDAAYQFTRWIHGGGKVLPGLVTRRNAEARYSMANIKPCPDCSTGWKPPPPGGDRLVKCKTCDGRGSLKTETPRTEVRGPVASRPAYCQMCAWRVGNHQIPFISDNVSHIAFVVRTWGVGFEYIATHSVMASMNKSVPHPAAKLTRH